MKESRGIGTYLNYIYTKKNLSQNNNRESLNSGAPEHVRLKVPFPDGRARLSMAPFQPGWGCRVWESAGPCLTHFQATETQS